jgi:hypothetical protein
MLASRTTFAASTVHSFIAMLPASVKQTQGYAEGQVFRHPIC